LFEAMRDAGCEMRDSGYKTRLLRGTFADLLQPALIEVNDWSLPAIPHPVTRISHPVP
jgi:hypothetical protein